MLAGKKYIMRQMSVAALLILVGTMLFSTATSASELLAITRLVMRDRVVAITSGQNGLQYSVTMKDGTVLDANLSEAQLKEKHPVVYEQVRPAVASGEATPGVIQWAGM